MLPNVVVVVDSLCPIGHNRGIISQAMCLQMSYHVNIYNIYNFHNLPNIENITTKVKCLRPRTPTKISPQTPTLMRHHLIQIHLLTYVLQLLFSALGRLCSTSPLNFLLLGHNPLANRVKKQKRQKRKLQ